MKTLTVFEETAINDLAVSMFDWEVSQAELHHRIEDVARLLQCTTGQLIAYYVRPTLQVFEATSRMQDAFTSFNIEEAREMLRRGTEDGARERVSFG